MEPSFTPPGPRKVFEMDGINDEAVRKPSWDKLLISSTVKEDTLWFLNCEMYFSLSSGTRLSFDWTSRTHSATRTNPSPIAEAPEPRPGIATFRITPVRTNKAISRSVEVGEAHKA